MQLTLKSCEVRSWRTADAEPLARHADNRKIWLNLRDAFPHPYSSHDAREFITSVRDRTPETTFAIAVDEEAVGSVGFVLRHDVERVSAEIGYWLAEPFWGRGIGPRCWSPRPTCDLDAPADPHLRCRSRGMRPRAVCWKAGYVPEGTLRSDRANGENTDRCNVLVAPPAAGSENLTRSAHSRNNRVGTTKARNHEDTKAFAQESCILLGLRVFVVAF
jgi:hypothetical protein